MASRLKEIAQAARGRGDLEFCWDDVEMLVYAPTCQPYCNRLYTLRTT